MKSSLVLLLLFFFTSSFAQEEESTEKKGYDPTNLFTGGSISFNLGRYNNTFLAGLNPHFGYTIASWIDAAAVVNFQYYSARDVYANKCRSTTYGVGLLTRIYPAHFLFIQAQPEYNFIVQKIISTGGIRDRFKINVPSLLLGEDYVSSRRDKNSFTYLSILVDVLNDRNSPYVDAYNRLIPIVRGGINIGLNRRSEFR